MTFNAETWIQNTFFSLQHAYDPVKAREYYLKTRELKGRKSGVAEDKAGENPTSVKSSTGVRVAKTPSVKSPGVRETSPPPKTESNAAALREAATKRQAQLRARLERLETVLAAITEKAQAAAGVKPESETDSSNESKTETDTVKDKPKSAAEKKEAAKKAQEDYEKNKTSETNESAQALQDQIEEVQQKISDARETLQAAIARAKTMTKPSKNSSVGVSLASSTKSPKPGSKSGSGLAPVKPPKTAQAVATPKKGERQNGS